MDDISLYIPHYRANMAQDAVFSQRFLSRAPTKLFQNERSVCNEDVATKKHWKIDLDAETGINVLFFCLSRFCKQKSIRFSAYW